VVVQKAEHLAVIRQVFKIPDFLGPWLNRFFEPIEFDLILALAVGPSSPGNLLAKLELDNDSKADRFKSTESFLERAYKRGIINYREDGCLELADFHARFEIWAIFEGWKDIPSEVREQLNAWEIAHYENHKRELIENLKEDTEQRPHQGIAEYLLLHETDELLDRTEHIYLWPCNCRAMMERCKKPLYTCLRFVNDRGLGWEISRERAKEITRKANQKGLMQVAEIVEEPDGSIVGGLCNCCADCCFPHLLAKRLESEKNWPLSRYVAQRFEERCTSCGICVQRCPFQAFQVKKRDTGESTRKTREIFFNGDVCRGCGVCATGCPEEAIKMIPLLRKATN
jgi:Pyruvate/2-oxoacid:ferredoxin oxidoreductase delta subunit